MLFRSKFHSADKLELPFFFRHPLNVVREAGVMPSMGSTGDAYDNAMAESFFATLEREVLNRRRFQSQTEARMAIFQWLEGWYNPHRRHSALGYLSPINYERRQLSATA